MCGISGIFNGRISEDISKILFHRGPDANGTYIDDICTLHSNRLAIVDMKNGIQPMENERYVMVFNGEIYNFRELSKSTGSQNSTSDTKSLLDYLTKQGLEGIKDIRGIFAIALYDKRSKNISLIRDRMGVKPLFYSINQGTIKFGSELKSLRNQAIEPEIDEDTLADFFIIGYPIGKSTLLKNTFQVEPGKIVTFDMSGTLCETSYYNYFQDNSYSSIPHNPSDLAQLINSSVKEQVDPNWPILLMLSGGLDSGTLLHSIVEQFERNIIMPFTYSEKMSDDDYINSRKIADYYGLPLFVVNAKNSFLETLPEYMYHLEDISYDSYAIWCLSKEMARHGKVGYCGQGPDELFGGYEKHQHPAEYLSRLQKNFDIYLHEFSTIFRNKELIGNYLNNLRNGNKIQETTKFDVTQELPNLQLWQYDRVSMAHGLELRVPYLDERIVSFSAQLDPENKVNHIQDKVILRQAAKVMGVPEFIWNRPKYLGGQNIIKVDVQRMINYFAENYNSEHPKWSFFNKTNWMKGLEPVYCGMMDLFKKTFEIS
jgi:asparagine synthase (glutamine-hydrolysing)